MLNINVPVDMISRCSPLGELLPIKFRIENDQHQLMTVKVDEVLYKKESQYAGVKTLEYGCRTTVEEKQQLIEVRYHVSTHKWTIKKVVY